MSDPGAIGLGLGLKDNIVQNTYRMVTKRGAKYGNYQVGLVLTMILDPLDEEKQRVWISKRDPDTNMSTVFACIVQRGNMALFAIINCCN